eukprot:1681831-Rhodomonas_salina.1
MGRAIRAGPVCMVRVAQSSSIGTLNEYSFYTSSRSLPDASTQACSPPEDWKGDWREVSVAEVGALEERSIGEGCAGLESEVCKGQRVRRLEEWTRALGC